MRKALDMLFLLYVATIPLALVAYFLHDSDFWSESFFLPFSAAWKTVWANGNVWDSVLQILVILEYAKILPYFFWIWKSEFSKGST